jgi:hypothetical protein
MKVAGICVTVLGVVGYALLTDFSCHQVGPQWLWRGLQPGCIFALVLGLRLFGDGIKNETLAELRKDSGAKSAPSAE